jgi:hypothetical protein
VLRLIEGARDAIGGGGEGKLVLEGDIDVYNTQRLSRKAPPPMPKIA